MADLLDEDAEVRSHLAVLDPAVLGEILRASARACLAWSVPAPAVAPRWQMGDIHFVGIILLSLILAGLALAVIAKSRTSRHPRVFVIASLLGGLAGMELVLLNGAWQGGHLSDGGVLTYVLGMPVPMVAPFLAAGALLGAVAGVLYVLMYRGVLATRGRESTEVPSPRT